MFVPTAARRPNDGGLHLAALGSGAVAMLVVGLIGALRLPVHPPVEARVEPPHDARADGKIRAAVRVDPVPPD